MNIKRVELTSKAHPYANERLTCKREYAFFAAYHREVKAILKSQGLDKVSTQLLLPLSLKNSPLGKC
jgi:hypothetical protein